MKWLRHAAQLEPAELLRRYASALRPNPTGPVERHDLTIKLWAEKLAEDRSRRA